MIVKCPECGAKYKVDESKIPPEGLNLPCPKCKSIIHIDQPSSAEQPQAPQAQDVPSAPPQVEAPQQQADSGEKKWYEQFSDEADFSDVQIDDDEESELPPPPDIDISSGGSSAESATPETPPDLPWDQSKPQDESAHEPTEVMTLSAPPVGTAFDLPEPTRIKPEPGKAKQDQSQIDGSLMIDAPPELDFSKEFEKLGVGGAEKPSPAEPKPVQPEPDTSQQSQQPDFELDSIAGGGEAASDPFANIDFGDFGSQEGSLDLDLGATSSEAQKEDETPLIPPDGESFDQLFSQDNLDLSSLNLSPKEGDKLAAETPKLDEVFSFDVSPPPEEASPEAPTQILDGAAQTELDFGASGGDILDQIVELSAEEEVVRLYKVRRKSGRVFGPFPESTVIEMFKTGKLAREDEISGEDGEWKPITTIPAIRDLIAQQAPEPAEGGAEAEPTEGAIVGEAAPERRRKKPAKAIFEARTAVKAPARRKTPILIAVGAIILMLVAAEVYLRLAMESSLVSVIFPEDEVSRYSYSALSPQLKQMYARAENAILKDSYKEALSVEREMDNELRRTDFRGKYALLGMDVTLKYFMVMRYGLGKDRIRQANKLMADAKDAPETLRSLMLAKGMQFFYKGQKDKARTQFQKALQFSLTKWDALAVHLIAWSFLDPKNYIQGEKQLAPLLQQADKAYPFTLYLMARFAEEAGDKAKAKEYYQKVLEKSPNHFESKLALILYEIDDPQKSDECEEKLRELLEKHGKELPPILAAKAHYGLARIYMRRNEPFKVIRELNEAIKLAPQEAFYTSELGNFLFKTHEYTKAYKEFERCLKIDPKEVSCHVGLAKCMLAKGKADEALLKLKAASRVLGEDNPEINFFLGRTLEHQKLYDKALKNYERAIALNPKEVRYYVKAAEICLKLDNIVRASEYVQKAKAIDPDSPLVHNFLGKMYLYKEDPELAVAEFKVAIERAPDFIEAYVNLGDTYRKLGKYDEAIEVFNKAIQLDDKYAPAHYGLGLVFLAKEEYESAAAELELAVRYDPKHPYYHYALGEAYYALGRKAEAAAALKKETEISIEFAPAYFLLGRVNADAEKWEDAISAYEQAIHLDKQNPYYHFYLGKVYYKIGREKTAIEYLETAINLKPDYAEAWLYKGLSLMQMHKPRKAEKALSKAIEYDKTLVPAYIARARIYTSMGKLKKAERDYLQALKLKPDAALIHYELGVVYQELGLDRKALKHLLKAQKLDPTFADVYVKLGYTYKKLNNRAAAIKMFKRYLELAPNAPDAPDVRDEIEYLKQ